MFDQRPSAPISAVAGDGVAVGEGRGDRAAVLGVVDDLGAGAELDQRVRPGGAEQGAVQVAAVDDAVGVAEAGAEGVVERDAGDLLAADRVHQAQAVDVDGERAGLVADAEPVEAVEGVRAELDAGADLAEDRRLLEDDRAEALLGEAEGGGDAADAAAGDEDGESLGHLRFLPLGNMRWVKACPVGAGGAGPRLVVQLALRSGRFGVGLPRGCASAKAGSASQASRSRRRRGNGARSRPKRSAENICGIRQISARPGRSPKAKAASGSRASSASQAARPSPIQRRHQASSAAWSAPKVSRR